MNQLTSYQIALYNFTSPGMQNVNIKKEVYESISSKWVDIVRFNLAKGLELHYKLFERYIDEL